MEVNTDKEQGLSVRNLPLFRFLQDLVNRGIGSFLWAQRKSRKFYFWIGSIQISTYHYCNSQGSDLRIGDQTSLKSAAFIIKYLAWSLFLFSSCRRWDFLKSYKRSPLASTFCLELVINQCCICFPIEPLKNPQTVLRISYVLAPENTQWPREMVLCF